jgi:hypothetical protein
LFLLGGAAYTWRPLQRLRSTWQPLPPPSKLAALATIPVIRLVGDIAKMIGYPVGVWWRLTSGLAQNWRTKSGQEKGQKSK